MQIFSADAIVFKKIFFWPQKHKKKLPSKVAHNRPFLFHYWPGCTNSPKTEILYPQKPPNARLGIQTGDEVKKEF